MIVVRGYRDGHRIVEDLGPGEGRIQGHGGEALGSRFVLTAVKQAQQRSRIPRQPLAEARRVRCGFLLPYVGEPCYRLPGHHDSHRSEAAMRGDAARRRTGMANGRPTDDPWTEAKRGPRHRTRR